jgi:hypothetical protein
MVNVDENARGRKLIKLWTLKEIENSPEWELPADWVDPEMVDSGRIDDPLVWDDENVLKAVDLGDGQFVVGVCRGDVLFAAREIRERGTTRRSEKVVHEQPPQPPPAKCTLNEVHAAFRKWLGDKFDIDTIDAVIAAAAAERLTGDPLWLLVISGPGNAKTETVQSLMGCGAQVTSTIASEGALLSGTSRKDRNKTATGGLLRKIGDRGILVIKDFTSILSGDRHLRPAILAALREIYDGRWERNVGTDGGQTLTWVGRIAVVAAVTSAWDTHHTAVAAMGDRFVSIRSDSALWRKESGAQAIRNTGKETQMRQELAAAIRGVVYHASTNNVDVSKDENAAILNAANVVTLARTAVERDYQGEVVDAHAPEAPTRLSKQLAQIIRGGVAAGMSRERAMQLALRCARDSIPPLRLHILLDLVKHPGSRPSDVRERIGKPWRTVKREMEALHMLGLLREQKESETSDDGKCKTVWVYKLAEGFDHKTLSAMAGEGKPSPEMWVSVRTP